LTDYETLGKWEERERPEGRLGLGDLAGLQAARADVRAEGSALLDDADLLQVRIEPALGGDHGVGAALTEGGTLAAGVTDTGHEAGKYRWSDRWVGVRHAGASGPFLPA